MPNSNKYLDIWELFQQRTERTTMKYEGALDSQGLFPKPKPEKASSETKTTLLNCPHI